MKIAFVSNYFNHHQKPLSDRLYELTGGDYTFIGTTQMREERRQLGYKIPDAPYTVAAYESVAMRQKAMEVINSADVVICGSADYSYIGDRIKSGKLVFKYGERPLRNGIEPLKYVPRLIKWNRQYPKKAPVYLLCSSAYAPWDYSKIGMFTNKAFKWGYFTQTKCYDNIEKLFSEKEENSMLWVGRMLPLKHLDHILEMSRRLLDNGVNFSLRIIGNGPLEDWVKKTISDFKLENNVQCLGAMSPEQVREQMERSKIFLFSSNKEEGWGAVVNEAMNSGCAVVASHAAGSVPFLVNDQQNGMIYTSGNVDMLYDKTAFLINDPDECKKIGLNAYKSITDIWNAEVAGSRFIRFAEALLEGKDASVLFDEGPCSRAEILKDNWFE